MAKLVPLISSGIAGPLGVRHLPRLWLKVSLKAKDKLADGYPDIGLGFDAMVLNALGLDAEAVRKFIAESSPTYTEFENWIKRQPDAKFDKATIHKLNASISGYVHDEATRDGILGTTGLPGDAGIVDAVNLNNLDDWYEFHKAELAKAPEVETPPIPPPPAPAEAEVAQIGAA